MPDIPLKKEALCAFFVRLLPRYVDRAYSLYWSLRTKFCLNHSDTCFFLYKEIYYNTNQEVGRYIVFIFGNKFGVFKQTVLMLTQWGFLKLGRWVTCHLYSLDGATLMRIHVKLFY
jgi:hypothetical protein